MSQIVIKRAGEVIRTIAVPPGGITVTNLAQHLREQRGGVRPQPFDVITVEEDGAPTEQMVAAAEPKQRSCGT